MQEHSFHMGQICTLVKQIGYYKKNPFRVSLFPPDLLFWRWDGFSEGFKWQIAHLCALIHCTAVTWARRGLPPPAPLFWGGWAGEKGGKRNPHQTAPTPSRSPGPERKESDPALGRGGPTIDRHLKLFLKRVKSFVRSWRVCARTPSTWCG